MRQASRCRRLLLSPFSADLNTPLLSGVTPLNIAADDGHDIVVREQLAAKADTEQVNKWGDTALKCAVKKGHKDIVAALRSARAKVFGDDASAWYNLGVRGGGGVKGTSYTQKECYGMAIKHKPKHANAWYKLGVIGGGLVNGTSYSQKECYEMAIKHKLDHANAWCNLGVSGGGPVNGTSYTQKECFGMAIKHEPKHADAWHYLGSMGGGPVNATSYTKKECFEMAIKHTLDHAKTGFKLNNAGGVAPRQCYNMGSMHGQATFEVVVIKGGGDRLGMDVDLTEKKLLIDSIKDGLISQWNVSNPSQRIQPGDHIIEINGCQNDSKAMVNLVSNGGTLRMTVMRANAVRVADNSAQDALQLKESYEILQERCKIIQQNALYIVRAAKTP